MGMEPEREPHPQVRLHQIHEERLPCRIGVGSDDHLDDMQEPDIHRTPRG
jgi:hypothetical protein